MSGGFVIIQPRPPEVAKQVLDDFLEQNLWIELGQRVFFDPTKVECDDGRPFTLSDDGLELALRIDATLVSKKNQLVPGKPKKNGKMSKPHYSARARLSMDEIIEAIPGALRDLQLVHPDVEVFFYVDMAGAKIDKDGIWTTVLDCLVKVGLIQDDSIEKFNGTVTLHPANIWRWPCVVLKIRSRSPIRL